MSDLFEVPVRRSKRPRRRGRAVCEDGAVKLGALVWPQYTDWQSLRETGELVDRLGYDSLWTWDHLYPIVGDPDGPDVRGLPDAGRLGRAHRERAARADGRREHVPEPRAGREDDHHARPHERRPDEPRDRRRLVRDRAHRVRDRVRLGLRRAARLVRRGGRADAGDASGRPGVSARPLLPGEGRAEQPAARPGAPADHDRRQRRAEDAAHGGQVRRRLEHRRRPRTGQAQGLGAPPLVR